MSAERVAGRWRPETSVRSYTRAARTLPAFSSGWSSIWAGSAVTTICLLLISVLGAALRLYCLDCHSLWRDEVYALEHARLATSILDFTGGRLFFVPTIGIAPLIAWLMIQITDPVQSAAFVRLPSAIGGALLVPFVYALGR